MAGWVELVAEGGPIRGQRFRFETHDLALVGRAEDCHIRLPEQDPTTSRHHFILEVNPPQARLRDLGSLAGTYVNGTKHGGREAGETPDQAAQRQYPEVDLADGDQIYVGQHVLRVAVYQEPVQPAAPPPAPAIAIPSAPLPASERLGPPAPPAPEPAVPAAPPPAPAVFAASPPAPEPPVTPAPLPTPEPPLATPSIVPEAQAPAASPAGSMSPSAPAPPPAPALSQAAAQMPAPAPDQAAPGVPVVDPDRTITGTQVPGGADNAAGAGSGGTSLLTHLFQQIARAARGAGPDREAAAESGRVLGEYEVEKEIGRGSMGAVYLARHRRTGERVALKVMVAQAAVDERARLRFMREVETTRTLRHPNIVALREAGAAGTTFYFTMEYCAGGSVGAHLTRRAAPLAVAEAFPLMTQVLDGMAAAHAAGFVHRDVKPDNLLLVSPGSLDDVAAPASPSDPLVKVADFGLAKHFVDAGLSGLTVTGTRGGTLTYMPREQLVRFRDARPASDVWALGATFYVMLAGRPPRQAPGGRRLDPITLVLQGEIAPLRQVAPGVPEWLAAVVDRALSPAPEARYQSAGEMRAALVQGRP